MTERPAESGPIPRLRAPPRHGPRKAGKAQREKPKIHLPLPNPVEHHLEPWDCILHALLERIERREDGTLLVGLLVQGQWLRVLARILNLQEGVEPGETVNLLALEGGILSIRKA